MFRQSKLADLLLFIHGSDEETPTIELDAWHRKSPVDGGVARRDNFTVNVECGFGGSLLLARSRTRN
jgi:hypothetical protein